MVSIKFRDITNEIAQQCAQFYMQWNCHDAWETGIFVRKNAEYTYSDGSTHPSVIYKVPEFKMENEAIGVTVHTLIVPTTTGVCTVGDAWNEEFFGTVEGPHKRTRKNCTLTSFLSDVGLDGTKADQISRAVQAKWLGIKLTHKIFYGQEIIDQYREMSSWSVSCMTGSRSNCVEIYAENPSQLALIVFYHDGEPYGRVMLWRPLPPGEWKINQGEVPIGPGWKYTRVYTRGLSMGCTDRRPDHDIIAAELKKMGLEVWDNRDVVYTKKGPEGLCPYLDYDMQVRHSGGKVVLYVAGDPHSGWEQADSRNTREYGNGFHANECTCGSCGETYDGEDEDAGYVNGWGDCCPSCYQEGVFCEDTDEVHCPDDVLEIHSRNHDFSGYATDGYARYVRNRSRIQMVRAETASGDTYIVPEDETICDDDGNVYWYAEGEDPPICVGQRLIVVQNNESGYPEFKLEDYSQVTFTPVTAVTPSGSIQIEIDPAITRMAGRAGLRVFVTSSDSIMVMANEKRVHVRSLSILPFEWVTVDEDYKTIGSNVHSIPPSMSNIYNGQTMLALPAVDVGNGVTFIPMAMTQHLNRRVFPLSDCYIIYNHSFAANLVSRPMILNDIVRHDDWASQMAVRDANGDAHRIGGYYRYNRNHVMFVVCERGNLIGIMNVYNQSYTKLSPRPVPSNEIMRSFTGEAYENYNQPTDADTIASWLNGGTDVVAQ